MRNMLKKLPRSLFILNYYAYPLMTLMVIILLIFLLSPDNLTPAELGVIFASGALLVLLWWRFHARQSNDLPTDNQNTLPEIWRPQQYTLLAFESEYCPICMTMSSRVSQLQAMKLEGLKIYQLSIMNEPGHTLFERFNGRATPTYILLDSAGNVLLDWPIVIPLDRIRYAVSRPATRA